MKRLIASDIHGSLSYCRKLLELFHKEQAKELILLGDLTFSGLYTAEFQYDPQGVIDLLNTVAHSITCVEGNCDTGLRRFSPTFPTFSGYTVVTWEDKEVFLTHGHRYSPRNPPPMGMAQLMLSGHTHIPSFQRLGDLTCANPGSVSMPRGGSAKGCLLYEDGLLRWVTLDGKEIHREQL